MPHAPDLHQELCSMGNSSSFTLCDTACMPGLLLMRLLLGIKVLQSQCPCSQPTLAGQARYVGRDKCPTSLSLSLSLSQLEPHFWPEGTVPRACDHVL